MSDLKAQKKRESDIVHIYKNGENLREIQEGVEVEVSVCGSCERTGTTLSVTQAEVINNDYLKEDGDIIGKICGNCSAAIERNTDSN
jgi:hypothetical protein